MKTTVPKTEFLASAEKKTPLWPCIALGVIGVGSILMGVSAAASGKATGRWGFSLDKTNDPILFWVYVAFHFIAGAWILLIAWRRFMARCVKAADRSQSQRT